MTNLERDVTAIDTTLTGLRAIAKAVDRLDRRLDRLDEKLDTVNERLEELEKSSTGTQILDDQFAGGVGLLRKRIRTLAKMGKKKKKR
jgi:UDP-N-acetylmuramyl pentapeptide synthase